jgi:hypothetical protein
MSQIAVLYVEELKGLMRGRFAWLGAAVVLLAVGALATVGTQDTWLDGYGIVAYGILPLGFIPVAACVIASPRANRFVECVFTAPVDRRDWLLAKALTLLTLAAAYYAALLPMLLVYVAHVGLPFLLHKFLWWTAGLLVSSVAVGLLVGVLFIGRSIAAPAGAGMGVLLLYAGLMPLQELMVAQGNGAGRTGHLALASPAVLLKNALGFALVTANVPSATTGAWVAIAVVTLGAVLLSLWVFLRAQGVETWEASRLQRWTIGVAILGLFLFPMFVADTNYDATAPHANGAPALRGISGRAPSLVAFVPTGAPAPTRCCSALLNRETSAFGTDEANRGDLLLFLPVETTEPVTALEVHVTGEGGLEATVSPVAPGEAYRLDARHYDNETGPVTADGHHATSGWVARVPVTFTPTAPWDIGGDRYPLAVAATYRVGAAGTARTFTARATIDAQVARGIYEMGAASSVLPLVCLLAALSRWRRTR